MNEEDIRRSQLQARIVAMENEVARLTQDLKLGQKALDEGAAFFEAIHLKHLRNVTTTFLANQSLQCDSSLSCFRWKKLVLNTNNVLKL